MRSALDQKTGDRQKAFLPLVSETHTCKTNMTQRRVRHLGATVLIRHSWAQGQNCLEATDAGKGSLSSCVRFEGTTEGIKELENIAVKCDEAADGHDAMESCPSTETYDDRCCSCYRKICPTRELYATGGQFYLGSGHICEEMKGSPFLPLFLLKLLYL